MMTGSEHAKPPEKLYKFRAFSARSLELLNRELIYYSDPTTFNDPLDCAPSIRDDLATNDLVRLCHVWEPGDSAELPVGDGLPQRHRKLDEAGDAIYHQELVNLLNVLLRRELGACGVLSLTARWNSPLMWSHYAAQHQGVCIEYDTRWCEHPGLQPVDYEASRSIKASDLYQWKVNGSAEASARVRHTYYFAKAPDWAYEHEWRYVQHKYGELPATLKAAGIYFGSRCPQIVRVIFMSLLSKETTYWEVFAKPDSFDLDCRYLNRSEEIAMARGSSAYLDFSEFMASPENRA